MAINTYNEGLKIASVRTPVSETQPLTPSEHS